ncbi:hypothetical protein [Shewanella scandinavica]|uniref:hypothetical protein n=1 Tax=Shewanella scandinavica TaxID=3063538 RepID=UPI00318835AF
MIAKKITQAQLLFPKSQYPMHRAYIDLFLNMLVKKDICVSESDIEILSIALGDASHQLFKTVSTKTSVTDKLDSLFIDGLKLKIEVKKRLTANDTELSKDSNKGVLDLIFEQYNSKPTHVAPKSQIRVAQQITIAKPQESTSNASLKLVLAKKAQEKSQKSVTDTTDVIKRKTIQARALFPENLYPQYRLFIEFLIQQATNAPLRISSKEMKSLSSAFGAEELAAFTNLSNLNTVEDKLKHITFSGLQLKISAKKRLKDTGCELSKIADISVITEITKQYQSKLDAIEAKKNQDLEAQRQAIETERLRALSEAESIRKKKFSDFPEFGIKNILKNSPIEKILQKLLRRPICVDEKKLLDNQNISNELIEKKYHLQLAHQHYQNWKQKNMPWELVNASAAYRKGGELKKIRKTLNEQYPFAHSGKDKKLKSALLTTFGGVCRDQEDFTRGIELGHEAHKVTPLNFRPCTLLGAIYLSTVEFDLGHEWYGKAKDRGFTQNAYDNDIKSVYFRASDEIKSRLKQNLIATGHKYDWLSKP